MPQIWCMNLIDNRDRTNNRNVKAELKFQLCQREINVGYRLGDTGCSKYMEGI